MAAGIGAAIGVGGNLLTQIIGAIEKSQTSKQQKAKAGQLEAQANAVVPENPLNDPAFKMKQFLAEAGLPGYEQYKLNAEQEEANAVAQAQKSTRSSGALLNFLGAAEGQKNKTITNLDTQNAAYIEGKKVDLANQYEQEKVNFDAIARDEKQNLNYAATQYENAALGEKQAGQEQVLGGVGSTISGLGQLLETKGTYGATPTFGMGGTGTAGNTSLSLADFVEMIQKTQ